MTSERINHIKDKAFGIIGLASTLIGLIVLSIFIINIVGDGFSRLSMDFMNGFPSRFPEKAGIMPAWVGTIWIFFLTSSIAIPIGISASIYLEEYGKKNWFSNILEINISNLAGVPSIIYGILGLEIFVRIFQWGESLLTGAFVLALLVLPIIIVTTRESLKAVPNSLREASYALGASKWQTIWLQVLPAASGSITTGIILALARAIGETAPLIMIGALTYIPFIPTSPMDEFTVLPMQIFNWISRPQHGFTINAAAAIIVLLVIVFVLSSFAIYKRIQGLNKTK